MLSYETPRNLSLSLNLQNTTSQSPPNADQHEHDETIDENTKLLEIESQGYVSAKHNGNIIKNVENDHMNPNLTYNSLCNIRLISSNKQNNNSLSKPSVDEDELGDSVTVDENSANNNDESNNSNVSDKVTEGTEGRKVIKMTKLGSKNANLKRVSFGSSKGSMVETLIFETPTPLPEHAEKEFFPTNQSDYETQENILDENGIELQEELERSRVKVTFFQSIKPQQISPPNIEHQFCFGDNFFNNNSLIDSFLNESENKMSTAIPDFERQMSTDSGWDNPFRPDGDLSREADEIVNLIKGGKPITPTGDHSLDENSSNINELNGNIVTETDGATKLEVSPLLQQQNGTKSPQKNAKNGDASKKDVQPQVSNQTVPGPQSASCVVVDEKKKKSCKCCVIQ